MAYYNKIVILSLPLQIIVTPLFLVIGVISLLCFFYVPIYKVDSFFITILKGLLSLIKPLSFGINMPELNQFLILLYYALYTLWIHYYAHGFVPFKRALLVAQLSFLCLYGLPIKNYLSSEVDFINVGQGDCTLIRNKDKVALIDTGGLTYTDIANGSLIPYLKKKRIYVIDTVIITHYDYDHYGALQELNKTYPIRHLYDYHSSFPVKMNSITFNNYNYYAKDGTTEENDKSLVIGFNACHKDFLIMGDAPTYVEKEIIKHYDSIPCDILKVGHHGSSTSSCEEWIKYTNPDVAIISCGKNNRFGHPNQGVVTLLNKYQIKMRRTDLEGTITFSSMFV